MATTKKTPRIEPFILEDSDVVHVEPSDELATEVPTLAPPEPLPTSRTQCSNCGEWFEGSHTDHYLAKHAPR